MIDFRNRTLLVVAIAAALGFATITDAQAQSTRDRNDRYNAEQDSPAEEQEAKYPNATREEPETEASRKMAKKLNAMVHAYNDDQFADARAKAAEILADEDAGNYERSLAAQISAHAAYDMDDIAATKTSLQQVLDLNGLDNNAHYGAMFMLAQLQLQDGEDAVGLATLDRFLSETGSTDPQALILKGNTLYNMERYPEAAEATKKAIDASPNPDSSWVQLLMGIYFEMDKPQEAARIAEQIAAKNPDDKRAQLNLASIYLQADQMDKAAAVLEKARNSGQLTEERDYRQLYATYLNMDGKEADAIAVIEEGLQKGILKPNNEVYLALAQSYYYTEQDDKAIEAYRKAAPLDDDGGTYLNLAKVLWRADRIGEAKQAAQQALDKGIKDVDDARQILALPGG